MVAKSNETENENISLKRTLRYVSHELLNVLTLVEYSAKQVREEVQNIEENMYWKYIQDDVDYMIKLLSDLANYNHCTHLRTESFNFSDMVVKTAMEMNAKYEEKAKIVTTIEGESGLYMINADKQKLKQVIVNIVKNAVEAIGDIEDGIVILCLKRQGVWINVEIIDNGCGIESEYHEKVFDEGVTINKKNGSGLGLPISKKIIESHGGQIEFKSAPSKGTIFNIKIPIQK